MSESIALVPDVLLDIFLAVSAQIEPLKWAEFTMNDGITRKARHFDASVRLRELTHVCRYWRDIAVHTPKLWSNHIDCTNMAPKWYNLVLERAQDAHLFVTIPRPYTPRSFPNHTLANFEHLLASGKLFGGLHADVLFHSTEIKEAVFARMAEPMPVLHECTWFYYPPDPKPLNLFAGDAPALRKLHLRGFLPTIDAKIRLRLTHLIILDGIRPEGGWIEFLRPAQYLEELTIGLEIDSIDPGTVMVKLDFPRLTSLTIEGDYRAAGRLLAAIDTPSLKHLNLSVNNVPRGSPGGLFDPLAEFLPSQTWGVRDTAEIQMRADLFFVKVAVLETGFTVALRVKTYGVYKDAQFLMALTTSFKNLFASCNHLVLDGLKGDVDRLHNDPFIILMLPFENLTNLTLHKAACTRVLSYRSYKTRRFEEDVHLFPSLQTMVLHCTIVKHYFEISTFLSRKVAEGRPVHHVSAIAETISTGSEADDQILQQAREKQIEDLRKEYNVEVDFFKWDGKEQPVASIPTLQ